MLDYVSPFELFARHCDEMCRKAHEEGRPIPTTEEMVAADPLPREAYFGGSLPKPFDHESARAAREAEEDRKALEQEQRKLERLIEKRQRMLFCAGVTSETLRRSETEYDRLKVRLQNTKAWRGLEWDIRSCRDHIEYLQRAD